MFLFCFYFVLFQYSIFNSNINKNRVQLLNLIHISSLNDSFVDDVVDPFDVNFANKVKAIQVSKAAADKDFFAKYTEPIVDVGLIKGRVGISSKLR